MSTNEELLSKHERKHATEYCTPQNCSYAYEKSQPAAPAPSETDRLLPLGHCPWDVDVEEGDALPEPHCHANSEGECDWAYCPQPLLRAIRAEHSATVAKADEIIETCADIADQEFASYHSAAKVMRRLKGTFALKGEEKK